MSVPLSATDQGNIHWSREETMVLIELYRQHPCLWNVKVDMYRDKRAAAPKQITEDMNRSGTTVTTSDVKRKIESLRNQHRRELRKMQKLKKSGAGTEDIYIPTLWCFDALHFLIDGDTI
ncbi:putative Alcohol dehydrogenase transcription factor Myb/SANT-like-containing protein 32 [Homarus americanus]|uniref:Putative Alcohol dehydrogenase transcription factor Myb/SANT-like-containing protein 32 n=1 Tax=Homarus americanus TaxID=6706 RepID=A0A8J5K5M8_HOMAM|nr:putative Alcohol dehydrogenase transcription factor Myb/SANT-like-containing protein 32 [Homarus americanus]